MNGRVSVHQSRVRSLIMPPVVAVLLSFVFTWFLLRLSMQMERIALRHQVAVYKQSISRPKLRPTHRPPLGLALSPVAPLATGAAFVQPQTVIAWQKKRFQRLLATLESERQAGPAHHLQGSSCAHPGYVALQPHVGFSSHCGRTPHAGHSCGHTTVEKIGLRRATPPHPRGKPSSPITYERMTA